ncbi:hypothetical protein K0B96_10165 [Horticoccus luteus]|uniref:Uncharacterized protein n=1 Tax=Horticoccus luteus TaxID=2862869 RepID=A0A8F9TTV2_9BACT|nr:hypothetical protein [Horticoccus luteus]QYM77689.1 hypothetical protein K0B96_10165 [Horticoccus luteus]
MNVRRIPRVLALLLLALAALIAAVGWVQRDLDARRRALSLTAERDLARLELRSLHNELAAEHLLAEHARNSDTPFHRLVFLRSADAAAPCAIVAWNAAGRSAFFAADFLGPLPDGESYVLLARFGTSTRVCLAISSAKLSPHLRTAFPWPVDAPDATPVFSLVRRSDAGTDTDRAFLVETQP